MALICAVPPRSAGRWRRGGSGAITDALAPVLLEHSAAGSRRACASRSLAELPPRGRRRASTWRPRAVADIAGDRLPGARRAARTAATGTGRARSSSTSRSRAAMPVDERGVPPRRHRPRWRDASRRSSRPSATSTAAGCPSGRSCWSASSTWPTRSARRGDVHPVWAYAHVPSGFDGDATEAILGADRALRPRRARADRRDGGPHDRARSRRTTPNYVGGDIITGANTPVQIADRPRLALDPYSAGMPRRLHLLGRDAAGRGRARDERLQRRAVRFSSTSARVRHWPR